MLPTAKLDVNVSATSKHIEPHMVSEKNERKTNGLYYIYIASKSVTPKHQ